MRPFVTQLWEYLTQGDFFNYFTYIMNFYFPYGSFFWILGIVLFSVIQIKTDNIGYSGAFASIYFVTISNIPNLVYNAYSKMAMQYFGLLMGLIAGYYLYKAVRG